MTSPEQLFTTTCAALFSRDPLSLQTFTTWPPSQVSAFFRSHGIGPLIFQRLAPQARRGDDPLLHWLRDSTRKWATESALQIVQLSRVLQALEEADIPAVLFKGTALAYMLYEQPHLRPRCDTDMIVPESHISRVRSILENLGFQEKPLLPGRVARRQASFQCRDTYGVCTVLDVHWSMSERPQLRGVITLEDLLGRALPLPTLAPQARAACHEHALLIACLHRMGHHHASDRLIWHVDILRLIHAMNEEARSAFVDFARLRNVAPLCARCLEHSLGLLGCQVDGILRAFLNDPGTGMADNAFPAEGPMIRRMASDVGALESWRARLCYLREVVFPDVAYMKIRYGFANSWLTPPFYLLRMLRGVLFLFRPLTRPEKANRQDRKHS